MLCNHCGKQNDDTNNYCIYCNTPLKNPENSSSLEIEKYETDLGFANPNSKYINPQVVYFCEGSDNQLNNENKLQAGKINKELSHKIRFSGKVLLGTLAVTVLAMVFMIYRYYAGAGSEYSFISQNAIEVCSDYTTGTAYIINTKGEILNKVISGGANAFYSPDHTAAILIGSGDHYYVNAKKIIKLDPEIATANISENGRYLIYSVVDTKNVSSLYLYDTEKGTKELINQIADQRHELLSITPDGKTVSYVTITNNTVIESFIMKVGEEPVSIGKDKIIIAVSNDAKYIYYGVYKNNSLTSLYVKYNDEAVLLSNEFTTYNLFFNKDYTEVMFVDGQRTYVSVKGSEKQKIADTAAVGIITPEKCINERVINGSSVLTGIETFQNKVILCSDSTLKYIGDLYQTKEISSITNRVMNYITISEDGNNLMYQNADSSVIKIKDLKGQCSKETYIENESIYAASKDLTEVYYISRNQLYYRKDNNEPVVIADNISNLCMNTSDNVAFFLKDSENGAGTLYYSSNGSMAQPVQGGDGVIGIYKVDYGIIYQKLVNGIYNTYFNTQGANFTILDGVNIQYSENSWQVGIYN